MKNQQWGVVIAAIIVCAAIVFAANRLQQTGIRIEDRGRPEAGNKTEAARRLGVSRKTLDRKFADWGDDVRSAAVV